MRKNGRTHFGLPCRVYYLYTALLQLQGTDVTNDRTVECKTGKATNIDKPSTKLSY